MTAKLCKLLSDVITSTAEQGDDVILLRETLQATSLRFSHCRSEAVSSEIKPGFTAKRRND